MKKLLLILFCLLALSANAYATDITIGADTLTSIPFNPNPLPTARSITVSVTNGSATVTSSAAFPANIVGIAGFRVTISSTTYVVASVSSTSSLTLTTNFAGITGAATMVLQPYVLFRVYPTQSFQTSTGENIQASTPGSGTFYKQVAVSIINSGSGNVAYMPEFHLPSTTDATINNQARYVFQWYPYNGGSQPFATYTCGAGSSQLALSSLTTPTTWTAICAYNAPGAIVPPNTEAYTKPQIDTRFPACSTDQLYYFAADGTVLSCLTLGTNLSITSGVLNASGGGGGGSIGAGVTGNIAGYAAPGTTLSAFTVGAQLTTSGTTIKTSGVRPAINAVVDYGVVCDGATNTLVALQNAVNAAALSGGGDVILPAANCRITGTLTVPGGVSLIGQGKEKTIISSVTNAVILDLVQGSGTYAFLGPKIRDLWVDGSDSGSSQVGIRVTDASAFRDVVITDVTISDCGSHGLSLGNVFSSEFRNIYSTSNVGYAFFYNSSNMPSNYFYGLYAGDISSTSPAGYRIKAGIFVCWSCNGINSVPGAVGYWGILGGAAGDIDGDLTASYTSATFRDSNIEGGKTAGLLVYPGSVPSLTGETSFVGLTASSGTYVAIQYDTDASLFPENARRGYIEDSVVFANSPASFYQNSQPIRSDGLPPLEVNGRGPRIAGGGFIATYYNTATSRAEALNRVDGYQPTINITTSTSFANPGGRFYRVNCAGNCTLTLPSPVYYDTGNEFVTVLNISTTGIIVTINANGGAAVNGGSYTLTIQNQAVTLFPDFTSLDWRVISNRIGAGSANFYALFDAANNVTSTGSLLQNSGTDLVSTGDLLFSADNTLDIGTASDVRPRAIYAATSVTTPRVYYGGGSASSTAGSATPEGAVTAEPGSMYLRTNGSWYIKASGSGNTGWTLVSSGGSGVSGSGSTGTLPKWASSSSLTDSILAENTGVLTTTGTQVISGKTISTDATNTVGSLTSRATFTKNNSNSRNFKVVSIEPTFNFGGANANTEIDVLSVNSTNTSITGAIFNLLRLKFGGTDVFNVDNEGAIFFANGVRQAFNPSTIVASLNVGQVAADPSSPVNGDVVYETNTNKFRCYENSVWVNCVGGSGTVTSVAASFTGGLISVGGSPVTSSGTLALTVAGTSGGIPYFSSSSAWASSAALTANMPVIGGGAGVAPSVGTRSGNTTAFVTTTGSLTSGRCAEWDANSNAVQSAAPCGSGTVNSGTQFQIGYYATSAAAISGNSGITTTAANTLAIVPSVRTSGAPAVPFLQVRDAADTGLSPQEQLGYQFGGDGSAATVTRTFNSAGGTVTTYRNEVHVSPTLAAGAATTFTNTYGTAFDSVRAGSNVTLTNSTAVYVKPSATTHHGIFADGQVAHTGDPLRVGLAGGVVVRFNAQGGTINSVFNDNGALSSGATDGFQYISRLDSATNPTGTPTSYNGSSPILLQNNTANTQYVLKGYLNSGWRDLSQSLGETSPAQITADQNNYNPGAVTMLQRWNTDASRQITGLTFTPTQMAGQMHTICNVGSQDIVLVHSSVSSTAANRFATTTAANITIVGQQCATAVYDGTTQRWRAWLNP